MFAISSEHWREKEGNVYSMEQFLELRRNFPAFSEFYKLFVREVVGKKRFDDLVKTCPLGKEISTPTDDAFALLVLENNEAKWADLLEQNNGVIRPIRRGEEIPDSYKSAILPKYTLTSGKVKSWSANGIERFNELQDLIKADRKSNKEFAHDFVAQQRKELYDKEHKQDDPADMVRAANDLGSDTESESEDTYRVKLTLAKKILIQKMKRMRRLMRKLRRTTI